MLHIKIRNNTRFEGPRPSLNKLSFKLSKDWSVPIGKFDLAHKFCFSFIQGFILLLCFSWVNLQGQSGEIEPPILVGPDSIRLLSFNPVASNLLQVTGDSITNIVIIPSLPRGLEFNEEEGLTGTPTLVSPLREYAAYVTNPEGTTQLNFELEIYTDAVTPPPHIDSVTTPLSAGTYVKGQRITITIHFSERMTLDRGGAITSISTNGVSLGLVSTSIKDSYSNTVIFDYNGSYTADTLNIEYFNLVYDYSVFTDQYGRVMENFEIPAGQNLKDHTVISLYPDATSIGETQSKKVGAKPFVIEAFGSTITSWRIIQGLVLYSMSGKKLLNIQMQKPRSKDISLNNILRSLPHGQYILQLKHDDGSSKLIHVPKN